jgi:hypothetical protein
MTMMSEMNRRLTIEITDKIATCLNNIPLVCGNADYEIEFVFDSEWGSHNVKTAIFKFAGKKYPQVFDGTICPIPVLQNTRLVSIGVFAGTVDDGTLSTSVPVLVECLPCITDGDDIISAPEDDVYAQVVALCEEAVSTAEDVKRRADEGEFNGNDYVLTEADEQKIADIVLERGVLSLQDNGGLVINEGAANGSYSVAGGTTDKSLVENLVGSTAAMLVDPNAAVANGELSTSYGVDTVAETAGTMAMGVASMAGAKGYYWHTIDFTNKTITLSTTRKAKTNSSATAPTNIDWVVGDYISIRNKDRGYGYCSKITKVSGNVITVDSLPFTEDLYTAILGYISYDAPYDRTIYAVYQEKYLNQSKIKRWKCRGGAVDLGFGAFAVGMQNGATGIFSEVSGRGNLAAGDYSRAGGRVTIASGEASDAQGQRTKALGYAAHAEGTADSSTDEWVIASGDGAHAENYACHAIGDYSHSQGHRTRALGTQSFTSGLGTVAVNATETVLGQYNIPTVQAAGHEDRVYKGEWDPSTEYREHECVQYQGVFYLCNKSNIGINPRTSTGSWVKFSGKTPSLNLLTIGNGSDDSNRSNAVTIDVNGNAWFAGTVTVGEEKVAVATEKAVEALGAAIGKKVDKSSLATVATTGKHSDLVDKPPLEKGTGENSLKQTAAKEALGENSFTMGQGTVTVNANEVVLGNYNIPTVSPHNKDREYVGEWKSGEKYIDRYHCVVYRDKYYLCKSTHTSGSDFEIDRPTKWIEFAGTTKSRNLLTIGNGSSDTDRSNAATIDIDGNAWFAGGITVDSIILKSNTAGSTARFKITVDDEGVLKATKLQ